LVFVLKIIDLLEKNLLLLELKQYLEMIQHGLLIQLMVQQILYMGKKRKTFSNHFFDFKFIRFPFVAISIALAINKQVVIGVIYNPILDLLYSAVQGKGAFKNGRPIKCSGQTGDLKNHSNCS